MSDSNVNRDADEIPIRPLQSAAPTTPPEGEQTRAMPPGILPAALPGPGTDATRVMPTQDGVTQAALDRTTAMQALPSATGDGTVAMDAEALLADAARRKKIEDDLRRLGLSPDEVRRLLNADSNSTDPLKQSGSPGAALPSPLAAPPAVAPQGKGRRSSAGSLNSFAAQLMSQRSAAQVKAVVEAEQNLPPFRDSSPQEARAAEQLLREAASLRRREKYVEAEAKCREAIALTPQDAAALELLGDLLQGVARIDPAMAAYKRAVEADPKRTSAERKLADLLVKQQQWNGPDPEAAPKNPFFAVFLSLLPGLGQFHNGDTAKGIFFLAADAICYYLIAKSPWGASGPHVAHRIDIGWISCLTITTVVYAVAALDAAIVAKRGGAQKSGWDL